MWVFITLSNDPMSEWMREQRMRKTRPDPGANTESSSAPGPRAGAPCLSPACPAVLVHPRQKGLQTHSLLGFLPSLCPPPQHVGGEGSAFWNHLCGAGVGEETWPPPGREGRGRGEVYERTWWTGQTGCPGHAEEDQAGGLQRRGSEQVGAGSGLWACWVRGPRLEMGVWASSEVSDAQTMGRRGRKEGATPGVPSHALPREDPEGRRRAASVQGMGLRSG